MTSEYMRTKKTNFLQTIVLITGIVYIAIGVIFSISPSRFGRFFLVQVNDEWQNQVRLDDFLVMIHMFSRMLAILLSMVGLSFIMPLFDPLKYRLMIYLFGAIFPAIASIFYLYNGFAEGHLSARVGGFFFLIICILHSIALFLTKDDARKGIE